MTHRLEGMKWGAVLVSKSGDGKWLLLNESIADNPMTTIETAEALWEKAWAKLQRLGVCLVRLNLDTGGVPTDLMYAWGQGNDMNTPDIMDYDEEFEKLNNNLVEIKN